MNSKIRDPQSLMLEVLQPRDPGPKLIIEVPLLVVEPGSAADAVVRKAAERIRAIALKQAVRVHADDYQCECAETGFLTQHDAVQTVARHDLTLASAVQAVFERALSGVRIYPTTLRAQVEMQLCAIDAARAIRGLVFKQQTLV